jgi:puromycin-sensitive aminopeptidase
VVRVYTLPGKKEKGEYALEVGVKAMDYYTEWYGIKQPLSKCDLIGIPDFAMGKFAFASSFF